MCIKITVNMQKWKERIRNINEFYFFLILPLMWHSWVFMCVYILYICILYTYTHTYVHTQTNIQTFIYIYIHTNIGTGAVWNVMLNRTICIILAISVICHAPQRYQLIGWIDQLLSWPFKQCITCPSERDGAGKPQSRSL